MQSDTAKNSLLNEETKRKQKINQGHFYAFECFLFCLIFFCSKYALPPFRLRPDKSVLSGNLNSRSRHKLQSSSTSRHNLKIRSCEDGCITAFKRSGKIESEKKIRLNSRVELITCTRNNKGPFCLVFLYKNRTHKGRVFE